MASGHSRIARRRRGSRTDQVSRFNRLEPRRIAGAFFCARRAGTRRHRQCLLDLTQAPLTAALDTLACSREASLVLLRRESAVDQSLEGLTPKGWVMGNIESSLQEKRLFPPSGDMVKHAAI